LEVQAVENTCVEESSSQTEVVVLVEDIERKEQGQESMAPASEDLKLVWEVKGIAGLSWGRQEGKLKEVLGQLVTNKSGAGASSLAGLDADDIMRDDGVFYEA
jgi:hypothetical protein